MKREVMVCPKCGRKTLHAAATMFPLLDVEGDLGWNLKVECLFHGWQSKGNYWTSDELKKAGLK